MEAIFQKIINFDQNLLAIIALVVFYTLEEVLNTTFEFKNRPRHLLNSALLQLGYVMVNFGLAFVMVACFQWIDQHHVGLFNIIEIPYPLKLVIGLVCFDFTFYWAHRLYHLSSFFWRLHRVHHSDNSLDSTSALRFHPFDALLDSAMSIVAAAIFGLDISVVLFYFVLYIPLLFAQHSNFIFPVWTDKVLGKIFASPNFHKVHHHKDQQFTDSNYGNLFIVWDKLYGTFKYLPVKDIKYGLEEFDGPEQQRLFFLLKSPFLNFKKTNEGGGINDKG
ncbi:sterol desaturase family protein [uncultured Mucilaginibacter sp.]|uniref:sterol desaturase family protein n=1 Tax=uncultured Mucilaginibacter sp. TaxID=797541 RepID=UPI0025DF0246|nr:sterol desaturase family protein [uncultured Mucilaginibacter sp.]